ncbi:hypothetical protein C8D88_10956 [Lentzea atacamensis]|uniref:DUF3558 domain-containing protein n=1 Tax=Lentzea atacamensis TaxID=531938 RepID=A0A316HRM3_9PSEU|nr:hypothetical protein [Lentzea atacamensis]PWK83976.1 hypothetical protein C8D88_10956 [Lentzea atacamensis]
MNSPQGWPQQPPQQGWQQQPPPPPQGGYPPQGHHPPPPGYPPPQQQKGKGPVIAVAIVAVVLLLGGLGTGGFFFFNIRRDQGEPLRTTSLPEACKNVSAETLGRVRTTNPRATGSFEQKNSDSTLTACSWDQTEGRDGSGMRTLTVKIQQTQDYGEKSFELGLQAVQSNTAASTKNVDGVGDQAAVVVIPRSGGYQDLHWVVRKGDDVIGVEYRGWDPGLFSRSNPDVAEQEAAAKTVVDDVLGEL